MPATKLIPVYQSSLVGPIEKPSADCMVGAVDIAAVFERFTTGKARSCPSCTSSAAGRLAVRPAETLLLALRFPPVSPWFRRPSCSILSLWDSFFACAVDMVFNARVFWVLLKPSCAVPPSCPGHVTRLPDKYPFRKISKNAELTCTRDVLSLECERESFGAKKAEKKTLLKLSALGSQPRSGWFAHLRHVPRGDGECYPPVPPDGTHGLAEQLLQTWGETGSTPYVYTVLSGASFQWQRAWLWHRASFVEKPMVPLARSGDGSKQTLSSLWGRDKRLQTQLTPMDSKEVICMLVKIGTEKHSFDGCSPAPKRQTQERIDAKRKPSNETRSD